MPVSIELRDGQHIGVVQNALTNVAPWSRIARAVLGMKFKEPTISQHCRVFLM
jgi:hypothetical protein